MRSWVPAGLVVAVVLSMSLVLVVSAQEPPAPSALAIELGRGLALGTARSAEPQVFRLETRVVHHEPDGTRSRREVYRMDLACTPGAEGDSYVCRRFTVEAGGAPEAAIPSLAGWEYTFRGSESGVDEKGQIFGLDQTKFQGLTDERGQPLPLPMSYAVFNSFVDFHGFCDVFGAPVVGGPGIQDLHAIGQRIVHAAAHSEPPVHLAGQVAEGSTFRNGEIVLELKGVSLVDGRPCALVGYDSGDSSFTMAMEPAPGMKMAVKGSSHYHGDIYVDLESQWPLRVEMTEVVVTQVTTGVTVVGNDVVERTLTIRKVRP